MKLQKAVKDETIFVTLGSVILSVVMVIVFFGLNKAFPEQVPMGLPVILGAAGGCAVAAGNFFLMALTVQKAADEMKPTAQPAADEDDKEEDDDGEEKPEAPLSEDAKRGKQRIQLSYTLRMLGLGVIAILGVTLPWFQSVAVLLPMLFPRIVIMLLNSRPSTL